MNLKVYMACTFNCLSKMEDFSRSQAVTYAVTVVVSRKWLLLQTNNYGLLNRAISDDIK